MYQTFVYEPLINILAFITAILPGHNFGLSIILFTILIRILLWPLVKKQLHHAKAMRDIAPEVKKIKKETKGDKQKQALMIMTLYKEKGIKPMASLGLVIVQIPVFLALSQAFTKISTDPNVLFEKSYGFVKDLSWMKQFGQGLVSLDNTLLNFVDLSRSALDGNGKWYFAALVIVIASAVVQYFQSTQLMPSDKDAKKLRDVLKGGVDKNEAPDSSEVQASVQRATRFMLPAFILIVTIRIAAALSLYWLISGAIGLAQQTRVLKTDEVEMETGVVVEKEIISNSKTSKNKKIKSSSKTTVVIKSPGKRS